MVADVVGYGLLVGADEEGVLARLRSLRSDLIDPTMWFQLAIALAWLNRLDEARSAVEAGLAFGPAFTISRARRVWTEFSDDGTYLIQVEGVLEGLRKVGVPE